MSDRKFAILSTQWRKKLHHTLPFFLTHSLCNTLNILTKDWQTEEGSCGIFKAINSNYPFPPLAGIPFAQHMNTANIQKLSGQKLL